MYSFWSDLKFRSHPKQLKYVKNIENIVCDLNIQNKQSENAIVAINAKTDTYNRSHCALIKYFMLFILLLVCVFLSCYGFFPRFSVLCSMLYFSTILSGMFVSLACSSLFSSFGSIQCSVYIFFSHYFLTAIFVDIFWIYTPL